MMIANDDAREAILTERLDRYVEKYGQMRDKYIGTGLSSTSLTILSSLCDRIEEDLETIRRRRVEPIPSICVGESR